LRHQLDVQKLYSASSQKPPELVLWADGLVAFDLTLQRFRLLFGETSDDERLRYFPALWAARQAG
jgi:hypothetical protein